MRRIAEKLFLYDSVQRALVEEDMEKSAHSTDMLLKDGRNSRYLQDFLDQRDAVPRPISAGQTKLGKYVHAALQNLSPGDTSTTNQIAQLFWTNQILRKSTYHVIVREMLQKNHPQLAEDILQSMLMTRKSGLNVSTYTLCLETAMQNNNHQWFLDLAKRVMQPKTNWTHLQHKFDHSNNPTESALLDRKQSIDTQFAGMTGLLLLAEGFMKFGHPNLLNNLIDACQTERNGTRVKILTANLEAANRWQDRQRASISLNTFLDIYDPSKLASVRFLLVLKRNPHFKKEVLSIYKNLSPSQQHNFDRLSPMAFQYHHPYALRN